MRKALLSIAVVLVTAIGVTSGAGAAGKASATPARLSTQAAAADYLRSLGIDPAGVVVQRGAKNYAGPNCPGPEWNCTTARQVLQISARVGAASANNFSCTPAGGGTVPPNKCVIVQTSTTGNNTATCTISGTTSATQECQVTQTSTSGTNRLALKEELILTGAATSGTQVATVDQNNGSGANIVGLTQRSSESISSTAVSIGTWSQSASQSLTIDQDSVSGTNSAEVSQAVSQTQTAANATTGSQSQFSDQQAEIDQSSSGVSTMKIKQSESQRQTAKAGGSVTQSQVGPQGCCSSQTGNPNNTATIKQEASQTQSPTNNQTQEQSVVYTSTGNITGTQTASQDGTTSTNSFSGSTVAETQSCTDGTCTQEEPPPPPPDSWTSFTWTGGDGAVANGSPFSVSAEAPVVFSITDAFCKGDQFTVSDGETTLGTTSAVAEAPTCGEGGNPGDTSDPAVAFADPTYSHGTFALAAGAHQMGIVVSNSPFGQGGAYFSVDPMTTAHCTGGRWATFTSPTFTSEADCLAFVT
jgi:hypothetical protein